jgi:hypothetical protein
VFDLLRYSNKAKRSEYYRKLLKAASEGSLVPSISESSFTASLLRPVKESISQCRRWFTSRPAKALAVLEGTILDVLERTTSVSEMRADRLHQAILKRAFEGTLVPQNPSDEPASLLLNPILSDRSLASHKNQRELHKKGTRPPMARGRRRVHGSIPPPSIDPPLYKMLEQVSGAGASIRRFALAGSYGTSWTAMVDAGTEPSFRMMCRWPLPGSTSVGAGCPGTNVYT